MNEIALYDKTTLTDEQEACLPLLAAGLSIHRVSKIQKIPSNRIRLWMEDGFFSSSLERAKEEKNKIIQSHLDQAGILAMQYAIDVLSTQPDEGDIEGRRIQSNMAKTVIGILASKTVNVKIETPSSVGLNNIDEESKKIVQQHSAVAAPSYVVIDNAQILEDEPVIHKECSMGILNKNYQNEKIQCHICGGWHLDFVLHIRTSHGVSPSRYRNLYQIPDDVTMYVEEIIDANNSELGS